MCIYIYVCVYVCVCQRACANELVNMLTQLTRLLQQAAHVEAQWLLAKVTVCQRDSRHGLCRRRQ